MVTYIETTRCDVCADECTGLCVAEFKESVGAGLLLHLAMQMQHRQVDEVEQLGIVLDGITTGKEDLFTMISIQYSLWTPADSQYLQ